MKLFIFHYTFFLRKNDLADYSHFRKNLVHQKLIQQSYLD